MIDPALLLTIHKRLVLQDPTASADLFLRAYEPLVGFIIKNFRRSGIDEDQARDLAVSALVRLVAEPQRFDPERAGLFGYLCMDVGGDAKNLIAQTANRRRKFSDYSVEVEALGGKSYETRPEVGIDARRIMDKHLDDLVKEPRDRQVLDLLLADEKEYDVYARALGIEGLPEPQRSAEVKRRKDRIEKRLHRLRDKL
jgi:RNA polymerase sigma factor (sigma-70 family)